MNIERGIKGIRKIVATDAKGWHVTTKTVYLEYYDLKLSEIMKHDDFKNCTIIGFTGNGICIRDNNAE